MTSVPLRPAGGSGPEGSRPDGSDREGPRPDGLRPTIPPIAALVVGVGIVILFLSSRPLFAPLGLAGHTLAQWGFLAVPTIAALALGGFAVRRSIGWIHPTRAQLAGGTLIALGALPLNGVVAWLQSLVVDVPVEVLDGMRNAFTAESPMAWLWILFAAALTPAVCEEVVWRGLLLHPLRGRIPGWLAVAGTSLAFGAMHWMPQTGFRILPAAFSGALIGWAVWRTGSLLVGVWMHFVNNGLLLTAAALLAGRPEALATETTLTPSPALVAGALMLVALGGRLVHAEPPADSAA